MAQAKVHEGRTDGRKTGRRERERGENDRLREGSGGGRWGKMRGYNIQITIIAERQTDRERERRTEGRKERERGVNAKLREGSGGWR